MGDGREEEERVKRKLRGRRWGEGKEEKERKEEG